jgi:hypothetical protein
MSCGTGTPPRANAAEGVRLDAGSIHREIRFAANSWSQACYRSSVTMDDLPIRHSVAWNSWTQRPSRSHIYESQETGGTAREQSGARTRL